MRKTALLLGGLFITFNPVAAQNLFPGKDPRLPLFAGGTASRSSEKSNSEGQNSPIFKTAQAENPSLAYFRDAFATSKQAEVVEPSNFPLVTWKDGKTTFTFANAKLSLSNRMQLRFTNLHEEAGDDKPSFRVRRCKTKLAGWVYDQSLRYELQLNWANNKPLEDANVSYDLSQGKNLLVIKAGQFKVPFGRQELTSSGNQEFVDRSIVSTTFAKGRDIGLQVSGLTWNGKLDWQVGAFNGAGPNATANDNTHLQVDARLSWQPLGKLALSEGDLNVSPKPKIALAAQYESNDRRGTPANEKQITWGGDSVLLWRGLFLFAEFFHSQRNPVGISSYDSTGLAIQGGFCFVPNRWEVAARYGVVNPSDRRKHDLQTEVGLALNYFIRQHGHKLQADLRRLEDEKLKEQSWEFRLQYQLVF